MKLSAKVDITLSKEDIDSIKRMKTSYVHRWHNEIKSMNLKVGDVLVKYVGHYDEETCTWSWRPLKVNNRGSTRKYVVVHIDNIGVPYIKSVYMNGEVGNITALSDVQSYHRYGIDPEYAEHILLNQDDEYDPISNERNV